MFYEKQLVEGFLCDSHHNQSTLVGTTESYNELFRNSAATRFCRAFTAKNSSNLEFVQSEQVEWEEVEEENHEQACAQFAKTFYWEASRKSLSSAMWLWLTICEAKESGCLETTCLGPRIEGGTRVNFVASIKTFMKETDDRR